MVLDNHKTNVPSGVVRAYDEAKTINPGNVASDESRKVLFGQTDITIRQAYAEVKGSE